MGSSMTLRTGGILPPSLIPAVRCAADVFLTIVARLVLSGEGECFVVRERFQCLWVFLLDSFNRKRFRILIVDFTCSDNSLDPPDPFSDICPFRLVGEDQSVSAFRVAAKSVWSLVSRARACSVYDQTPSLREFLKPSQMFWFNPT